VCINQHKYEGTDRAITDLAIAYLQKEQPDFTFLYLGETDERGGHSHGWMSPEYMQCLRTAWDCIQKVQENMPEGYTMVVVADHGGHARTHGTTDPQDMTIPMFWYGPRFEAGRELENASIKDVATTAAALLEVEPAEEWEGKVLL
jgi:phosphopentomutase